MRIAINTLLLSVPDTGSGQYISHLLQALAAHDDADMCAHEYLLCSNAPDQELSFPHRGRAEGKVASDPFRPLTLRSPLHGRHAGLDKVWWEQVSFPRACAQLGADVAHVPYFASALWPRVPTVVTVLDLIPLIMPEYRTAPLVRLYTTLAARSTRRATRLITISEWSKRDAVRLLGVPAERVHVVYLAADARFRPADDPALLADLRARHGLAEHLVFYLGGFDARKDVATLVRAFAAARAELPGWQLVIAGRVRDDSPLFPDPRPVARELGLRVVEAPARDPGADVVFTGRVSEADKPLFYAAAGVFAFPSRYEGFGLDPLEALACGAPVVCSNATSLPEVVG
ncbi:MAG: glycosyltransferase family 4 protein, partial [Chloroflexi bacterium]|nr:glycosyltransferase family 4 protein [Chloroflexota bacterium]